MGCHGGLPAALAQQRSNIVQLTGDATVNGRPLNAQQTILTGDQLQTGPGSSLIVVIGNSAFHVRPTSPWNAAAPSMRSVCCA